MLLYSRLEQLLNDNKLTLKDIEFALDKHKRLVVGLKCLLEAVGSTESIRRELQLVSSKTKKRKVLKKYPERFILIGEHYGIK